MLSVAGSRDYFNGSLSERGNNGYYWSSSEFNSTTPYYLSFDNTTTTTANLSYQGGCTYGGSVRCMAQ